MQCPQYQIRGFVKPDIRFVSIDVLILKYIYICIFFLCFFKSGEEGCNALNIKYGGFVEPDIRFVGFDVLIFKYTYIYIYILLYFFLKNQERKDAVLSIPNMEDS